MKVVWCVNTQMPAVGRKLGETSYFEGGWMEALRKALQLYCPDVELHIISVTTKKYNQFSENNTTYYGIQRPAHNSTLRKVIRGWRHGAEVEKCIPEIARTIKTIDADVVHIHGTESIYGLVLGRINTPAIISIQGIVSAIMPEFLNSAGVDNLVKEFGKMNYAMSGGKLHQYYTMGNMRKREKVIVDMAVNVFGRTDWDMNVISLLNPTLDYNIGRRVLRQPFYNYEWEEKNFAKGILLTTSGWGPYKGLDDLIEAFCLLKQTLMPKITLRIICGNVSAEDMFAEVLRRNGYITENMLEGVEFLNGLVASEIAKEIQKASLFVCPSHIDNSPNSLAEAICVGIPCVGTFVGGIPFMLGYGRFGRLCSPSDPYSIIDAIIKTFSNPNAAKEKAKLARVEFHKNNAPEAAAKQIVEVYGKLVRENQPARNRHGF